MLSKLKEAIYILNREVTERKRAEEALQNSEERYRAMFEHMSNAVAVYKAVDDGNDFIFVDFNRAGETIDKIKKEEIVGRSVLRAFPGVKEFGLFQVFQRVWRTGIPEHYPVTQYRDERITGWRDNLVYKLPSGEIIAIYSDETGRKQTEEERIRLATAIEQAYETMMIIGTDGTIQYVNPALTNLTGYSQDELIGNKILSFEKSEDQKRLYQEVWEVINKGEIWRGNIEPTKKDGSICNMNITVSPVHNMSGNISSFVSIGRDITKELEMEEQLRQSQKMESMGTLAGGIAHEFNNILGAMIGYTELSLEDAAEGTLTHSNMKEILKAGRRAKNLVKQILNFSRQDKGELKPTKISPVLKEALKFLRASLPSTIEMRQNIRAETDTVLSDVTKVHQVLMNLVTNAAHAMREKGGVLEVRLENMNLDPEDMDKYSDMRPGQYLRLTVSDTGHGMDRAVMERVFDPFFTTKQPGEGTGMGLSVVHGIVKSFGGSITVESEPGEGTTFQVLLPCAESDVPSTIEETTPIPTGSESILFVDDEEALVGAGQQILERLGYKVDVRTNPVEALEAFREQPEKYNIVITDLTMPGMTGIQLARELISIRADMPVILCTGFSEVISKEKVGHAGIREYLMKPLIKEDLTRVIRQVLDK